MTKAFLKLPMLLVLKLAYQFGANRFNVSKQNGGFVCQPIMTQQCFLFLSIQFTLHNNLFC